VESRYFSSFDRTGRNADGFSGRYSTLYRLENGEHVIYDALGPGVLRTLWFTGPEEGGEGLNLGRIRFYFDDEHAPRIETDLRRLFGGEQAPFARPLVADNRTSTGGFVSWVPLPYAKRLIITTENKPSFFIAQYDTFPVDTTMSSWRPGTDRSRVIRALFERALRGISAAPLTPVSLDHRHSGQGTVEVIRFRPDVTPDRQRLQRARVQLWWDGSSTPAIDLPLGMFFGSGLGPAPIRSLAFAMQDRVYENRLPMPFWSGFRLRVSGLAGKLSIRVALPRLARQEAGLLHAVYRMESPTTSGEDFEWVNLTGAGKLVGTVLAILPPTPETKRWWEGDLRSYADGRRTPGLHGTGHEDDHLGGWSNTFLTNPFTLPMHGEPVTEVIEREGEQYNARTTLYRLWPGIHFMGAFRHSVEHGSENRVQATYAGVAWLYVQPTGPRLTRTDRLDLGDADSRRRHHFTSDGASSSRQLTSAFEGRAYRVPLKDMVMSHTGTHRFELAATPGNLGCWLRRLYDQQDPRQRAAIWIDGRYVADWYTAEGNSTLRWAERDLFLPAHVTQGRSRLQVEVRPVKGPPWSAAEYRLLCVRPAG